MSSFQSSAADNGGQLIASKNEKVTCRRYCAACMCIGIEMLSPFECQQTLMSSVRHYEVN